jgi:hypothetical protein
MGCRFFFELARWSSHLRRSAKVLNFAEDAHTKNMSTFEADKHLRGCKADPAPTGMPKARPRSSAKKTKPRSHVVGRKFRGGSRPSKTAPRDYFM